MSLAEVREEQRLRMRLDELKKLSQGWLDGQYGEPLDSDGAEWALGILLAHTPWAQMQAHLYPTPHGNLQVEWSHGTFDIELAFDLRKRVIEATAISCGTSGFPGSDLNLELRITRDVYASSLGGFFQAILTLPKVGGP